MIWLVFGLGTIVLLLLARDWYLERQLKEVRSTATRLIGGLHYDKNLLALDNDKWRKDYAELEKGMNEQQESFEQEYITFDETRTALAQKNDYINWADAIIENHLLHCLPNLKDIQRDNAFASEQDLHAL